MNLWLDDVRDPLRLGYVGWTWVKTYDEAVEALQSGMVKRASLDHDLSFDATMGTPKRGEKTGYDLVCWMEEHGVWPPKGVRVHSMNPVGAERMRRVIARVYEERDDTEADDGEE